MSTLIQMIPLETDFLKLVLNVERFCVVHAKECQLFCFVSFEAYSGSLLVTFTSDFSVTDKGFSATYQAVPIANETSSISKKTFINIISTW